MEARGAPTEYRTLVSAIRELQTRGLVVLRPPRPDERPGGRGNPPHVVEIAEDAPSMRELADWLLDHLHLQREEQHRLTRHLANPAAS